MPPGPVSDQGLVKLVFQSRYLQRSQSRTHGVGMGSLSQGAAGLFDRGAVRGGIEQDGEEVGRPILSGVGPGQTHVLSQGGQGVMQGLRSSQGWALARLGRGCYSGVGT